MEINQISQLLEDYKQAAQSTGGVLGNDSSGDANSSFQALLNQILNNSQNQTLNNDGTGIPNLNNKIIKLMD